jgi:acetate kinase
MAEKTILVINSGSSSLKFGLYAANRGDEEAELDGLVDGIGHSGGKLTIKDRTGRVLRSEDLKATSAAEALDHASRIVAEYWQYPPVAIGHRVVHGGPRLLRHQEITPKVVKELKNCVHFAPLHIPLALELIEKAGNCYENVRQFACFDTAFHTTMPETSARFALPSDLFDEGIRRYGFHGLSYESIVRKLDRELPSRTVIAHLGNGASLAAIKDGKSVDTTMGLTPTGGIPMATRSGDVDPGVLLYLQRVKNMDANSLEKLLNHDSGLRALSGGKSDMRELEAAAAKQDERAKLAIEIFCLSIRKSIAAYAAGLGGLDLLVFAGGIGEHSAEVRASVCNGLAFLGIAIDQLLNSAQKSVLSRADSKIAVRIVPSEEDRQIARHCRALLDRPICDGCA